jgi:diadenosine tetraphosphate (Ap4A) HIT family hydrolase
MILACKEEATCFPEISPQAFGELKIVMHDIELNLRRMVHFDKINYLALMMVDPHVHFHVVPRYAGERKFGTLDIPDRGWPKHPDLSSVHEISGVEFEKFCVETRAQWIRTTASA